MNKDNKSSITKEQREFVEYNGNDSVILKAVAGSGKTFSCVKRLKHLLETGVDPKDIIFFSYTNAAVDELKERVGNKDIKITTIHSFCFSVLSRLKRFKKITSFYEFIDWFKNRNKPGKSATKEDKETYYKVITLMYEEAEYISSHISSYKLQRADGIKSRLPVYYSEYCNFLKDQKKRDFADILIEVREILKDNRYLKLYKNKYKYVFVDEYQDTSSIQMDILLRLNAEMYYLIGDQNQSIYGYSSASCDKVEDMLKNRRKVTEMTLTTNFRSDKNIIENSNNFSNLKAIPFSKKDGYVNKKIISIHDLMTIIKERNDDEIAILVRTNKVIREIESIFLANKIPIRYENLFSKKEIKEIEKDETNYITDKKINSIISAFDGDKNSMIEFIKENYDKNSFITSIHKSKGREFDICIVVNSISPEIIEENNIYIPEEKYNYYSFDGISEKSFEAQNVHYVAVSRPRHELYFMVDMYWEKME